MPPFPRATRLFLAILTIVTTACTPTRDAEFWRQYQASFQQDGLLRTDRDPADAAFTNEDLIEHFRQIMFYSEQVLDDGVFREGRISEPLMKQTGPVGYWVGGWGVTDQDRAQVADIAARIGRASGLAISAVPEGDARIYVLIFSDAERRALAREIREDGAGSEGQNALVHDLENDLGGDICAAYTSKDRDVIILIPDELSGIMRQSCIEEEFGQAFGPNADYDAARPSIFNDDEEFALFTVHDELLFRVLYDPRLKDGMTEAEAMPIVRRIVAELRPEGGGSG